jgi:putative membrane protein
MAERQVATSTYTPWVVALTLAINGLIAVVFFAGRAPVDVGFDIRLLPRTNAVLNSFTTVFLLAALWAIRRKDVRLHRRFIYAAFTTTGLFLVTYLAYHSLSESTRYGGSGVWAGIYYFVLLTHIVLAAVIVPLALVTFFRGIGNRVAEHRAIARWTMPLWLYVSATGVIVYWMISPYY